jgi:hypothetical protein
MEHENVSAQIIHLQIIAAMATDFSTRGCLRRNKTIGDMAYDWTYIR